jgi:hypothetical protein
LRRHAEQLRQDLADLETDFGAGGPMWELLRTDWRRLLWQAGRADRGLPSTFGVFGRQR